MILHKAGRTSSSLGTVDNHRPTLEHHFELSGRSRPLILQALLVGDLADEFEREGFQLLGYPRRIAKEQL